MEGVNEFRSRLEIMNSLGALAQAQDDRDWSHVADFFLPDATYIHPGGTLNGVDAIVARVDRALRLLDSCQHIVGSIVVSVQEHEASSVASFAAQHIRAAAPGGELFGIGGRYADRWVETESGWRIASRTQTYQWRSGNRDVIAAPDLQGEKQ